MTRVAIKLNRAGAIDFTVSDEEVELYIVDDRDGVRVHRVRPGGGSYAHSTEAIEQLLTGGGEAHQGGSYIWLDGGEGA